MTDYLNEFKDIAEKTSAMTPQEFKAWFNGFVEAMEAVSTIPNKVQWELIKEQVQRIHGTTTITNAGTYYIPCTNIGDMQ